MITERLRKSVLQAAIQGKLTQQLPGDGDARDLLKQIQQEKGRLIAEGKLRKEKELPAITEDEKPFDIPKNWVWVKLGKVISVKGGKRIPVGKKLTKRNTGFKYIRVADMYKGTVLNTDIHYVPPDVYKSISNYRIFSNDG
jgi:type I restriction enzyme S subunit